MLIAKTALPAGKNHLTPVIPGHVRNNFPALCLPDNRALRHLQHQVFSVFSVTAALSARFPVSCRVLSFVAVIGQCVEAFIHLKNQIAAPAAVTTIGTAVGNVQFPPEAAVAVSAFAGTDVYLSSVCKHLVPPEKKRQGTASPASCNALLFSRRIDRNLFSVSSFSFKSYNTVSQCK